MGYELEGSEQATRTYEDDELDSTAEVLAADRSITGEILASEIPKASTLMVATTKAAACFLRAFAPPTTELAAIRFDQDASRLCTIWQSEQRSDLIFAHLESRVPADRAAEWADELLRISNTERVLCLHSLQPLDCHRSAMLQMCSITTDDFAESLPPLPPPYTLADEPAAIITRCQMTKRPAAACVGWEYDKDIGPEVLAAWEPAAHLAMGANSLSDLTENYIQQIKEHLSVPDNYIYS